MSADLLAGFDPYYVPPKSNTASSKPPSSTIDDLSFFESQSPTATQQNASTTPTRSSGLAHIDTAPAAPEDDFDGWGDFVSPVASPLRSFTTKSPPKPYGGIIGHHPHLHTEEVSTHGPVRPKARLRAATQDFFSGKLTSLVEKTDGSQLIDGPKPEPRPTVVNRKERPSYTANSEVLFDADSLSEDDDDDDFGDFEAAPPEPEVPHLPPRQEPQQQQQQVDLLSDHASDVTSALESLAIAQPPSRKASEERNPFAEIGLSSASRPTSSASSNRVFTPWPTYVEPNSEPRPKKTAPRRPPPKETHWDDPIQETQPVSAEIDEVWEDWGDDIKTSNVAKDLKLPPSRHAYTKSAPIAKLDDSWGWDAMEPSPGKAQRSASTNESPPTNVPPPSVLMAFFPDVLKSLQSTLFAPGLKQRILSNPSSLDLLKTYLSTAVVAAHVVAGRKTRWKRDTILSQSMSIGQAGAGGRSGMKLTGVDKTEAIREDREAGDFVLWWKDQVGRLRSAVAAANLTIADHAAHLSVPEISEKMPVRTATLDEGALTAPKCCFLCGLKRDERVLKIDGQVEDSFGEWWVDYWGHRACKDFWEGHSEKLKHR